MSNRRTQRTTGRSLAHAAVLLTCCIASAALGEEDASLRVCADPDNLPYSNEAGQGFENQLAELVPTELGLTLSDSWYPHIAVLNTTSAAETIPCPTAPNPTPAKIEPS